MKWLILCHILTFKNLFDIMQFIFKGSKSVFTLTKTNEKTNMILYFNFINIFNFTQFSSIKLMSDISFRTKMNVYSINNYNNNNNYILLVYFILFYFGFKVF